MALACGAVAALNALSAARFGDVLRASQRAYQDQLGYSNSRAEEGFRLARALRVLGAEAHASAAYERSLRPLSLIYVRQGVVYAAALAANVWFGAAMRVGALLAGAWAAIAHGLAPHELTACMLYVDMLSNAALHAAEQYGPIMEALGAGERVVHYLGLPPAPQLARGVVPGERLRGEIELRNVTFVYESRPLVPALDNVSLSIRAGERVAFVGLSGSGKSTLVALVQRLFDPTSGALLADGHDLRRLDAPWFRAQLGVVPQEPALFAGTVAENVALGNPLGPAASEPAAVAAALRRAHALGFVQALPRGLDATVGERTLSGGQRQRLAIARALLRDPAILVLDEATSALDAESEAEVQRALEEDAADSRRTVLVVAHRLATVRQADRIVVLDKGRVVEQGTHLELLGRGGIYAALVRRQLVMEGAAAELREGEGGEGGRERGEQAASTAPALPGSDCLPGGGSRGGCDACDMDAARGGELGG